MMLQNTLNWFCEPPRVRRPPNGKNFAKATTNNWHISPAYKNKEMQTFNRLSVRKAHIF